MNLRLRPFNIDDEPAALALEARCIQGNRPALRFARPSFAARSSLYERSAILVAETPEGKLVGITAWAAKAARLHGDPFATAVHYDLRVDPEARGRGVAQALMGAALEEADSHADSHYSLAAGQNVPVSRAIARFGRPHAVWPLEYLCFPVARFGIGRLPQASDAHTVRRMCLERHPADVVFKREPGASAGHVSSIATPSGAACASIWNGEPFLAEQIVRLPWAWHAAGLAARTIPLIPPIPLRGEVIRSWFLYDLVVPDAREARLLLRGAMAAARQAGRTMLYVLLHVGDPRIEHLSSAVRISFRLPYRLLFTGPQIPGPDDRMHVDPRDL